VCNLFLNLLILSLSTNLLNQYILCFFSKYIKAKPNLKLIKKKKLKIIKFKNDKYRKIIIFNFLQKYFIFIKKIFFFSY